MMLFRNALKVLHPSMCSLKRSISIGAPRLTSMESTLEQLCNEKVQEYHTKSSGGKMVDPSPEILQEMQDELKRLALNFGLEKASNIEEWPTFIFEDPVIDPFMEPKPGTEVKADSKDSKKGSKKDSKKDSKDSKPKKK